MRWTPPAYYFGIEGPECQAGTQHPEEDGKPIEKIALHVVDSHDKPDWQAKLKSQPMAVNAG